ncbi:Fic family protein [Photorhabdus namnaonensis]|uniref:Fic/DOC family protein n=1 Tax=Photorhabdus namnaonensis TaxID=1851568 RepID=A0A1B8YI29_9GAMM|nr:Fic family protein [Photorhabdus namnaonensis]OCA54788.1 Fic/DOC family protein [Photorhabdus namnaonensis]
MAKTGNERLAEALRAASDAAVGNVLNSKSITDKQRTLLVNKGYFKQIIRGWYLLDADLTTEKAGDSVLWYESIWSFVGQYVESIFGDDYWLSPESSLDLHTANNALPSQIIVYTSDTAPRTLNLPNNMSMVIIKGRVPCKTVRVNGINVHSLESALVETGPQTFRVNPLNIQLALRNADLSLLSEAVLTTKNVASGNRLIGAYEQLKMRAESRKLQTIMEGAGFEGIKRVNPFDHIPMIVGGSRGESPSAVRVKLLWQEMRQEVIEVFDDFPPPFDFFERSIEETHAMMSSLYISDAYNSLSIEGYKVTPELIERLSKGDWSPDTIQRDKEQKDAMAARGYYDAFNKVKELLREAHEDKEGLDIHYLIDVGLTDWFTALFNPCVDAGIINRLDLAGFRKGPIYIRTSMHVPPSSEQLMDCMEALKELIANEKYFVVKAILGHLFLGYIHPFPDGNGRTARFLMNFLLVIGGYPWTVIKLKNRTQYLSALESASVGKNVKPFAEFVRQSMQEVEHNIAI